ncbi:hypothetical protein GPECTOR_3g511 [Gonium pectorale]|uniref:Coenzyme PQQ synthesis protein F-like C-terminal lobe domain-containing protein n=1 Tax=Gonium pectorale TaxID=33097 RepID=A0A150GZZ1_GONPE|nr:hypothetical protein GPECTOR_3g511 [Gonium pectorale]|eukprot:KXZ55385.1 hypothetical protein GPECTOR_3g511 [Gonium pectorale]
MRFTPLRPLGPYGPYGPYGRAPHDGRPPAELRDRVAEWLAGFGGELRALPPDRLAAFKASLAERYSEPPRSLAEAARRAWQPVRYRSYDFGRRDRKAEALRALTLEDLVAFYERHVNPAAASARVLCCEIAGGAGPSAKAPRVNAAPAATAAAAARAAPPSGVAAPLPSAPSAPAAAAGWVAVHASDVAALHAALPYYCHSATLGVMRQLGAGSASAAQERGEGRGDETVAR